jgi:aspartate/methionine/tyrosine aminotransferase
MKPFLVERWFAKYEFSVSYNIAESCIQPLSLPEICSIAGLDPSILLGSEPIGYVDAAGSPELRRAIAGLYPGTTAGQVLVTSGAIEANYLLHSSLIEPGDMVICQFPAYQQLYEVARSRGADVRLWRLYRENQFHPDVDDLKNLARGPVKLIVVNNPHNPTGAVLSAEEMQGVLDIARRSGAFLHVDEVYNGIFYDKPVPSARLMGADVAVTSSMSKVYGLPGARIGWVAGPEPIVQKCSELRDYTSICPAMLSERLSLTVLRNRDAFLRRSADLASRNYAIVRDWMDKCAAIVSWAPPKGGVVCFPWYHADTGSEAVSRRLAEEQDVLVLPGTCFEHEGHFRLGFGYRTDRLVEGLSRLERLLYTL